MPSSSGVAHDNTVLELPEPRRPDSHEELYADIWWLPYDRSPTTHYEADEYAAGARVRSALFRSGTDAALRTYASAPPGSVLLTVATIHSLVQALLTPGRGSRPIPVPSNITAAAEVMISQLRCHLQRPVALPPGFNTLIMPAMQILAALSTSVALPRRWERIDGILHFMRLERFPVNRRDPNRVSLAAACYRSASHAGSIAALSRNTRLSSADWKCAIGMLGRTRFHAQSFMSANDFSRFLQIYVARGGEVDEGLFISYVKALAIVVACIRQPDERQVLTDHDIDRHDVFRRIRDSLHMLEHELLPRYPACAPGAVSLQLLKLYLHLPHRGNDIYRCWDTIMLAPPPWPARAAAAISATGICSSARCSAAARMRRRSILFSRVSPPTLGSGGNMKVARFN